MKRNKKLSRLWAFFKVLMFGFQSSIVWFSKYWRLIFKVLLFAWFCFVFLGSTHQSYIRYDQNYVSLHQYLLSAIRIMFLATNIRSELSKSCFFASISAFSHQKYVSLHQNLLSVIKIMFPKINSPCVVPKSVS